jgi:hypothetical protein
MIGVAENQSDSQLFQVFHRGRFDSGIGAYGHKARRLNFAVGQIKLPVSGVSALVPLF